MGSIQDTIKAALGRIHTAGIEEIKEVKIEKSKKRWKKNYVVRPGEILRSVWKKGKL